VFSRRYFLLKGRIPPNDPPFLENKTLSKRYISVDGTKGPNSVMKERYGLMPLTRQKKRVMAGVYPTRQTRFFFINRLLFIGLSRTPYKFQLPACTTMFYLPCCMGGDHDSEAGLSSEG